MSFYKLFGEKHDLDSQKHKLHAKVFSEDGIVDSWGRLFDLEELLNINVNFNILVDGLLSLSFSQLFDINLPDFDNWNVDFNVELPTKEDIEKGKFIKLPKLDFHKSFRQFMKEIENKEIPEEKIDRDTLIKYIFKEEVRGAVKEDIIPVGKYDETRYGECVFAPIDFIPKNLFESKRKWFTQKGKEISQKVSEYKEWNDLLIAKRKIIETAIKKQIFCDCWILDFSEFGEEDEEGRGIIEVEGVGVVKADNISEIVLNMREEREDAVLILDVTRLDAEDNTGTKTDYILSRFFDFIEWRSRRVLDRFLSPVQSAILSRTGEEKRDYHKHRSILKYGVTRQIIRNIRRWVRDSLYNIVDNQFEINKYCNLVIEYVFSSYEGHRVEKKWKEKLSDEEIRKYILTKAEAQGLNTQILSNLLEGAQIWKKQLEKLKPVLK